MVLKLRWSKWVKLKDENTRKWSWEKVREGRMWCLDGGCFWFFGDDEELLKLKKKGC